ncbi:cation transporter [Candidatus Saccharibacteria bacterium]|nr:cation transporter [Candidatus Saccharibacteria bacterium]
MSDIAKKYNGIIVNKKQIARNKQIVRVSLIGIIANVFLAGFKAIVGVISGSIAIVLDAVNNFSDAASSIVTIVGAKLATKAPDKKHPFGHGRIEHLSAMIIAIIVLYAGIAALTESIKKIIEPVTPDYTATTLIVVGVAVVVKIILGSFVKNAGKKLKSMSLVNSGNDAMLDSVISASTLLAAIIFLTTHLSLEAYLSIIISLVIIKSGFKMLKEAISSVLGERADMELAHDVNRIVKSFDNVHGVYDLVLNNYGPNSYTGSIHIEVLDTMTADVIDELSRQIASKVYLEKNVLLTAIGIYPINTKNKKAIKIKEEISEILKHYKEVLQFHGFYLNEENKTIRFDIVLDFDVEDRTELYEKIYQEVSEKYPEYEISIVPDFDFSLSA